MPSLPDEGGHRRLTREAAKDLVMMVLVLALVVAGMIAARGVWKDPTGGQDEPYYYERVAPKRNVPPSVRR